MQRLNPDAGANPAIRVGVSPCLLGQNVRYAGDHACDPVVTEMLGSAFDWVPTCPEVEIGLGIPRPTIRLERSSKGTLLIQPSTGIDLTARMKKFCVSRARLLAKECLAGYIFKSRSPSCGIRRTKLYSPRGTFRRIGRGFFAAEMMRRYPLLPVITEVELHDPLRRLGWIARVFATARLRRLWQTRWTRDALADFHESYALTLQSHSVAAERRLKKLLADVKAKRNLRSAYEIAFHQALDHPTSRAKQVRVLKTILRRLASGVCPKERKTLASTIQAVETGKLPLVEAVSVLRHYVRLTQNEALAGSNYLFPDPREWMLRIVAGPRVPDF